MGFDSEFKGLMFEEARLYETLFGLRILAEECFLLSLDIFGNF